jgi:hypothetical protein
MKLLHSPPYHPCSNLIAERAIQTVKNYLKRHLFEARAKNVKFSIKNQLFAFLYAYRNTPTAANVVPAQMIFRQKPRTLLTSVNPIFSQKNEKIFQNKNAKSYSVGEKVYFKTQEKFWEKGCVVDRQSTLTYLVRLKSGIVKQFHVDQLRKRLKICDNYVQHLPSENTNSRDLNHLLPLPSKNTAPDMFGSARTASVTQRVTVDRTAADPMVLGVGGPATRTATPEPRRVAISSPPLRRSERVSRPPERLGY